MTNKRTGSIATHGFLIAGVIVFAFPFYWLIVMASTSTSEIYQFPPRLLPGTQFWTNFKVVLDNTTFGHAFFNSIWLTAVVTATELFLSSLAGFVFAKRRFPGRDRIFAVLLVTLVLPTGVALVPSYQIFVDLHWINTYLPLIVPNMVTAFGVFWMRQYAEAAIPDALVDAAAIDGAGFFRTYWSVAVPIMRPAMVGLGVFQVMWTWNSYLWPLLVLNDPSKYTLPVALQQLTGNYGATNQSAVMAGSLVATLPLVVLFLLLRKTVLNNVAGSAVKG
jgi:cellobiose transport system permease protein